MVYNTLIAKGVPVVAKVLVALSNYYQSLLKPFLEPSDETPQKQQVFIINCFLWLGLMILVTLIQ